MNQLREERDRINQAIAALDGTRVGNGRKRNINDGNIRVAANGRKRRKRRLSAAARERISQAAKKRWAAAKKAGKSRL